GMVWSKCFGGTKNEELLDFEIINNRIYLAGYANSTDGDIPPSQKNYDVWLLTIDLNGNKIYSKVYGGAQNDVAYAMSRATDGSLTLAGYTTSNDGDVSGAKGSQDYWVVNIGTNGTLNWQKVLGGSDAEYANALLTDTDGGYLIGGISYSNDGDVTGALGEGDYWVVKLDATGNMLWTENRGGSTNDHLRFMVYNPTQDEYYLAGDSDSYDGDFIDGQGETDFAVLKFKRPMRDTTDSVVCNLANFVSPLDTLLDACGYDSVYLSYRPVLLTSPFELLKKRDTIFAGESITLPSAGNGTISWDPNPTLSCTTCPNPIATPTVTTVYRANNSLAQDCSVSDQFTVVVLNEALVHIPTAFTPNGDGKNDFFGPIGKVPPGYSMQVYNRNGELVFKSQSLYDRWDGVFRGKPQPVGVFIYYVKYLDLQNKMHQEKGTLVLIR
ncbi:MAG: gliding motility-associated C-terminal domain-containing protein, partial [Chitinophagaceae bacterium]|nr:gliding motility-associated C-terminal domain-containing protein [Chitinophagaceae bacterium]